MALVACAAQDNTDSTAVASPSAGRGSMATTESLPEPLPIGTDVTYAQAGVVVRATVLRFDPAAAPEAFAPPFGGRWAAAEVRTCVDVLPQPGSVDWSPWSLIDTSGENYSVSPIVVDGFPLPLYPVEPEPVSAGDCDEGWVVFSVPTSAVIDRVLYAPPGGASTVWGTGGA